MSPTMRTAVLVAVAIVAMAAAASAAVAVSRSPQQMSYSILVGADAGGASSEPATVTIVPGDSAAAIAQRLLQSGVIASDSRFELLVLLLGWEHSLEPGDYSFEPSLPTFEVLRRIHFGETSPMRVIIPEGLRLEQVLERLVEAEIGDAADLAAVALAQVGLLPGEFASQRPDGTSLEGYLFPTDYRFPLDIDAPVVISRMLLRFDEAISDELLAQINASGATMHEILTIASIIEREAAVDEERALISAVIWNRLAQGIPLQMNSTVQYAVGQAPVWWPAELSDADLALDAPYNSYLHGGLPPTPIASPGLPSIEAAANPANVPYLYFVAKGDGTHAFAETYEQHQANVERYLGGGE